MGRQLGLIGGLTTFLYIVLLGLLIWCRLDQLLVMPLNEIGDFLAGAFGPIAFLWLVLGFLQQGQELQQGTQALRLQAEELKRSVEQQTVMAGAATQQIEAQLKALEMQVQERENQFRPKFEFESSSRSGTPGNLVGTAISFINEGSEVRDVCLSFSPGIGEKSGILLERMTRMRKVEMPLLFAWPTEDVFGECTVSYVRLDGKKSIDKFSYNIKSSDPFVRVATIIPSV